MPENRRPSGRNMPNRPQPPPRFESRKTEQPNVPKQPEEKPKNIPPQKSPAVYPRQSNPLTELLSSRENILILMLIYILYKEKADPKLLLALAYIML
ncbi:MAG: hypothetical protein J5999_03330 [Oscillospiraceae bacterium]|nr:hypothetical protein [Oscillospiraceae bacterium]